MPSVFDDPKVQAIGFAARALSKFILVENGMRDTGGAVTDVLKAVHLFGLLPVGQDLTITSDGTVITRESGVPSL
jgi:hypothetical protein